MRAIGAETGAGEERATDVAQDVAELFRELASELRRLAGAITFDSATAEEVVQDAFVGLLKRGPDVERAAAYLHRSVVNGAIDRVRRRERLRLLPERRPPVGGVDEIDEVWPLIAGLPVRDRALIALRFYEDQTYEQIGETLDMPIGSVKSALHRALKTLKEQL